MASTLDSFNKKINNTIKSMGGDPQVVRDYAANAKDYETISLFEAARSQAAKNTQKRTAEQERLDNAVTEAQKLYDDYIKRSTQIAQQSRWGGTEKVDRAEGRKLKAAIDAAKQEAAAYKDETTIKNLVGVASQYQDDKTKKSDADKAKAVNLGEPEKTKNTWFNGKEQPYLFKPKTTEAQRMQKMGIDTWDIEAFQSMTEDELDVYNRLAKNGYEKEAQEFLDAIDSGLNYRVTKARIDKAREAAQEGFIGGAAASAGSTLLNVLGTGAQAGWATIRAARSGEAIDQYSKEMYGRNLSTALRSTVSEEVGDWAATLPTVDTSLGAQSGKFKAMPIEQQQESNRKIAEFLYNTGMSMVDMVAMSTMLMPDVSKFGRIAMSLIMGTNSGADSLIDAKNRGLSDKQAITIGALSGAAEILFETISLGILFNGKVSVSTLKAALIQGGVEASEEAMTELANTLADIFVAGDQSMVQAAINGYMEQGFDYQQAQKKAFVDVLVDIAVAGAGGFLSGFTMGGAVDIMNTNAHGRSVIDQTAQTFIEQGQTPEQAQQSAVDYLKEELRAVGALADEGTVAYELSQRAGDMSTGDIGRAYLANKEAIDAGHVNLAKKQAAEERAAEQETEAEPVISYTEAQAFRNEVDAEISEVQARLAKARPKSATAIELRKRLMSLRAERDSYSDIINDYATRETEAAQLRMAEIENELAQLNAELYEIPSTPKGIKQKPRIEARIKQLNDELDGLYEVVGEELYSAKEVETPEFSDSRLDVEETFIDAEIEKLQAEVESVQAEIDSIQNKDSKYAQKKQKRIDKLNNRIDGFIKRKAEIADIRAAKKENAYAEPIIPEPDVVDTTPAVEPEQAPAEMSQPASAQINDLRKQIEALPFKYSREGIEIRRKIDDLLAEMETQAPQTGGTDVQDNIGGNEPVPDEVKNSMKDKKPQQRRHEALKKRLNLSPEDANAIEVFVKQGISPERVGVAMMDKLDPQIALEYYNSYKQLNEDSNAASNYRKSVLNKRYEAVKNAVGDTLWKWKDKKNGLAYSRMTQERIIREIAAEDPEAAEWITQNIFEPVHINEAARTRWANKYAERAKAHNMTENENEFVHILITERDLNQRLADVEERGRSEKEIKQLKEALDRVQRDKAKLKERDSKLDESRCNTIADDFLAMYREIYEKLTGIQLKNGMPVTDFRSTYAPVVKDKKGRTVLSYLGIELETQELPTSIAGLTEFRKPGKPWFSHDLSRSVGYSTAYDMLGGLDEYLKSAGDVIFHTDDIQNVRMLENVIREATTPEGRAETLQDWIEQGITGEELNEKMQKEQLENSSLSNYVRNLREYGNLLANKKSSFDRGFENLLGRSLYRTMQNVKARITSNVLGGNISVVLSQAIPLTQAAGVISGKNLLRGIDEAGRAYAKDDGFNARSTFITNRIGYKNVAFKDAPQKVADAVAKPFNMVDEVVASAIVRGRYYDNLANGMSESAALKEADSFAAGLIADRSKGALPTIFGSKNPISTMLTMFQVEVNNQMDFMFKDLKVEAEKKASHAVGAFMSLALAKMFIAAFMYDEERKLLGLSANAFDPINWLRDASEEIRKGIDDEQSISETVGNIWDNTREQIPFIGGGRYGSIYENALPKFGNIADAVQAADEMEENAGKYVAQAALEELSKPVLYLGLPTGGAQLKKTAQGINALVQGESKAIGKQGEEYVQYTVAPTLGNIAGGVLFGKSGLKENKEWKASGFTSFSDKERDSYSSLKTHGGDAAQFGKYRTQYRAMVEADTELNNALKTRQAEIEKGNLTLTAAEALERAETDLGYKMQNSALKWAQQISRDNSLTNEQKADLIAMADFSVADIETMQGLTAMGVPVDDYVSVITKLTDIGASGDLVSEEKKTVTEMVHDMNLTADQKSALVRQVVGDNWVFDFSSEAAYRIANDYGKSAYEKYTEAKEAYGMTAEQYVDFRDKQEADAFSGKANGKTVYYLKQCRLANYVDSLNAPESVKKYIWDSVYNEDKDCEYENRHNKLKQVDGVWYTSGGYN